MCVEAVSPLVLSCEAPSGYDPSHRGGNARSGGCASPSKRGVPVSVGRSLLLVEVVAEPIAAERVPKASQAFVVWAYGNSQRLHTLVRYASRGGGPSYRLSSY